MAPHPCLSVVMPAYNEAATIRQAIQQVLTQPLVAELIVVDDGSTDATPALIRQLAAEHPRLKDIHHPHNLGKGAALRSGIQAATAPYLIIQDADLEYDPADFPVILKPLMDGRADVVYGSRFLGAGAHRVLYYWHYVANTFLTQLSNMGTNLNLTDMETCYKAFRREIIQNLPLRENRFGFEPEVTARLARIRPPLRIYEVPISYHGRTYAEGKKITWRDGARALWCILKYNLGR